MARTYLDVITRARRILQDEDATNYRYTEQSLMDAINDAVLEVRRIRPDLFIHQNFEPTDVDVAQAGITVIPIETQFFQSLVYISVGYQMLRDDEFSLDSRAVNLMNKGVSQLITVFS